MAKVDKNQSVTLSMETLQETIHLLNDICGTLCPKDHSCEGCRATEVLNLIKKDLEELNRESKVR